MVDSSTQLAIAELVIYLLILPVAHYLLFKHGRHGLEGWFFLITFSLLRIVAAGLQIDNWEKEKKGKPVSSTASIINSVGISALLLSCSGLIHEASTYEYNHQRKTGWIIMLIMHMTIAGGIAIAAVGGSKLFTATNSNDQSTDKDLLIAGYFIILAAMIGEFIYAFYTLTQLKRNASNSSAVRSARILIFGVFAALSIILARVIYSIVYGFTLKPSLSPFNGSLAVKVVLITLVQLLAALCIITAGLITRHIKHEGEMEARRQNVEVK